LFFKDKTKSIKTKPMMLQPNDTDVRVGPSQIQGIEDTMQIRISAGKEEEPGVLLAGMPKPGHLQVAWLQHPQP
jgi:hypothetical protein